MEAGVLAAAASKSSCVTRTGGGNSLGACPSSFMHSSFQACRRKADDIMSQGLSRMGMALRMGRTELQLERKSRVFTPHAAEE